MKHVTASEIKFISKILNLSPKKTKSLTEEERDLDLILDSISSSKQVASGDVDVFSSVNRVKLLLYRFSKDKDYDISEKSYVAKTIFTYLPKACESINLRFLKKDPEEKHSQYYLILSGFFHDKINAKYLENKHFRYIEDGFRKAQRRDLAAHIPDWVTILREIKREAEKETGVKGDE